MPGRAGNRRPPRRHPAPACAQEGGRRAIGTVATPRAERPLTRREQTVLRLLVAGKRNREISDELDISERTVKFHVSGLFAKLGVSSRTQLVSLALTNDVLKR